MNSELPWAFDLAGAAETSVGDEAAPFREQRQRTSNVLIGGGAFALLISLVISVRHAFVATHESWIDAAGIGFFLAGVAGIVLAFRQYSAERNRAERALREHELRYRLIVDATFDGIVISQNGFIKDANPGYCRMFGYEREELIGRSVFDLVADESRTMVTEKIRAGISGGYDVIGVRKDGSRFTFDTVVRVHGQGDHQIRVAALRDTTAQRRLEEQYRQSQKMEAVGRLAGGVAHDFNNLLTVILGYADMLLTSERRDDEESRDRADQLQAVRDAGENAASLTQQLLAFSRQQVLRPQVLSLNSIVTSTEKLLRRVIGEDIKLQSKQSDDLRPIEADPGQLSQVLMNLAVNARDAMPNGGMLIIETSNIDLDADYALIYPNVTPGLYVQLSVSDSGIGMDEETQRRIFEPFFTTKELGKGTGLGLASVYGIVQQSGGHIWVYSELGMGTTFKVYFPAVEQTADLEVFPEPAQRPLRGTETILIAEDAGAVRELSKTVLESYGYHVLIADNGPKALDVARQYVGHIDLLLTDVVMPGMNGRELAETMGNSNEGLKVLFMSGYTNDAVLQRGILGPGMTLLQKPFTPTILARAVRDVLDGVPSTVI
jgi:two-component system cell cycle sensor histidine kinase/response regulator CckA